MVGRSQGVWLAHARTRRGGDGGEVRVAVPCPHRRRGPLGRGGLRGYGGLNVFGDLEEEGGDVA